MDKWQIDDLLKNYQWKLQSVKIMRESMNEISVNMTAQYGLEAAMPKTSGNPIDVILRAIERRDERWKKIRDYEKDIQLIHSEIPKVNNECKVEVELLYWLLDEKSMK